jgi:predicted ATPase
MDSEKPSIRHFPGGIRDEPEERRRHDLRLDQAGSIKPASSEIIGVLVTPPGTKTLTVTPVPWRTEQLIAVANEQGFPFWGAQGTIYRGWVMVKNGDVAQGLSHLRSSSSAYRATGARPVFLLAAAACEIAGQIEEAVTLLDDALQIAERTGERWSAAELNRHKGQLLLRQGHSEAAEELYLKALSIAEEQGAKLWELRAATSLARLRLDQGRQTEARDLLAPVYAWFTEGFATPDLKEAKALLDEL